MVILAALFVIAVVNHSNNNEFDKYLKPQPWDDAVWYGNDDPFNNSYQYQTTNKPVQNNYYYEEPWCEDKLNESIQWQDFLEDIEMRGIWLDDPEAEEIWETYN